MSKLLTKLEAEKELKELGVDADPKAKVAELRELLENSKKADTEERIEPEEEDVEEDASDEPRIESEETEELPKEEVQEDYLRQYQVRKNTRYGSKESDPQEGSKAEAMKKHLLSQRKIPMTFHREMGEDKGIKQTVNLNGYRLDFPKMTRLKVPEQVSELIDESLMETANAINNEYLIDGNTDKQNVLDA